MNVDRESKRDVPGLSYGLSPGNVFDREEERRGQVGGTDRARKYLAILCTRNYFKNLVRMHSILISIL